MDCAYCPYHDRGVDDRSQVMSLQMLEETIRQAIEGQNTPRYVFSWQGGEPTLAGMGFFEEALALQKKYAPGPTKIVNEIQTNGYDLDEEWCDFLRKNNFRVALSVDGPPPMHDAYRRDREGAGTARRVRAAALLLHQRRVPFTALVAVNHVTARDPLAVYEYIRDSLHCRCIHFIPIIERRDADRTAPGKWDSRSCKVVGSPQLRPSRTGMIEAWSVGPEEYGEFLKGVFEAWRVDDVGKIVIPTFDALLAQWLDEPTRFCEMGEECGSSLVVDWDGTVYSCPFFLYPEYALGNVGEQSLGDMAESPAQIEFGREKAAISADCQECEFLFACHGGCPRRRFAKTARGQSMDMLCPAFVDFNGHVGPYFRVFAQSVRESQ
jgi:uncharacterized protein